MDEGHPVRTGSLFLPDLSPGPAGDPPPKDIGTRGSRNSARPHALPTARKRHGPEAEIRTAGSSDSIRAPISPPEPPISLSATTLRRKSRAVRRPHEERIHLFPRQSSVSTYRKTGQGFVPSECLSPKTAPGPRPHRLRSPHRRACVAFPCSDDRPKGKGTDDSEPGKRPDVPVFASAGRPHFENPA